MMFRDMMVTLGASAPLSVEEQLVVCALIHPSAFPQGGAHSLDPRKRFLLDIVANASTSVDVDKVGQQQPRGVRTWGFSGFDVFSSTTSRGILDTPAYPWPPTPPCCSGTRGPASQAMLPLPLSRSVVYRCVC